MIARSSAWASSTIPLKLSLSEMSSGSIAMTKRMHERGLPCGTPLATRMWTSKSRRKALDGLSIVLISWMKSGGEVHGCHDLTKGFVINRVDGMSVVEGKSVAVCVDIG